MGVILFFDLHKMDQFMIFSKVNAHLFSTQNKTFNLKYLKLYRTNSHPKVNKTFCQIQSWISVSQVRNWFIKHICNQEDSVTVFIET